MISTHYGIIKEGNLIEQVSRESLEKKCKDYFQIEVDDTKRALSIVMEHEPGIQAEVCDKHIIRFYHIKDGAGLNRILLENGLKLYASGFHHMDLEEYFLNRMDCMDTEKKEEGENA